MRIMGSKKLIRWDRGLILREFEKNWNEKVQKWFSGMFLILLIKISFLFNFDFCNIQKNLFI